MTRRKVEERAGGVAVFLEEIRGELHNGTYITQPVRQRLIPKPGKPGRFRPLGIPTLKDRLAQMTLKLVLEPIFEADFYPISYGFRRGRSTHDALARIQRRLHPANGSGPSQTRYVIEGDIKGCFDAIDHHMLMERVRRRIKDRKEPAHHTNSRVGKLFIPKSKLKQLHHKIKVKVKETPTGKSLADLIDSLNPIVTGWRNHYRYAGRAWREFAKLDWWLDRRVAHWVRQKHRGARWKALLRQYVGNRPEERRRWSDGTKHLEVLQRRRNEPIPRPGHRIPNGWNAEPGERFRPGADRFWEATNTLAKLLRGPPVAIATHRKPDAGKLARPVRSGG